MSIYIVGDHVAVTHHTHSGTWTGTVVAIFTNRNGHIYPVRPDNAAADHPGFFLTHPDKMRLLKAAPRPTRGEIRGMHDALAAFNETNPAVGYKGFGFMEDHVHLYRSNDSAPPLSAVAVPDPTNGARIVTATHCGRCNPDAKQTSHENGGA